MLRISIFILHALSVLSQSSNSEYFDKNESLEGADLETIFRYERNEDRKQLRVPIVYLYMAKDPTPPTEKQCMSCLLQLHHRERWKMNPCTCLPCWIFPSKHGSAQKFVMNFFKGHSCGEVMESKDVNSRRGSDEGGKNFKMESGGNMKKLKYVEDYLQYPDDLEPSSRAVQTKKSRGPLRSKGSRLSGKVELCVGDDCEDEEAIKAVRDESHKIVNEKVKKVFNDVLTKMARINKAVVKMANEEEDTLSVRNRLLKPDKPKWQAKSYHDRYRRPSFRVESSSDFSKLRKKDDEEDTEVKPISAGHDKTTKSKGKYRRSKADQDADSVSDDISIGSQSFEDPCSVPAEDDEDSDSEGDQNLDQKSTSVEYSTEHSSEQGADKDSTIQYNDEESEEKSWKNKDTGNRKVKQKNIKTTTVAYSETRNTPSDENATRSTTTLTATEDTLRSVKETTPPCGKQKERNKLRSSQPPTKTGKTTTKTVGSESESNVSSQTGKKKKLDHQEGIEDGEGEGEQEGSEQKDEVEELKTEKEGIRPDSSQDAEEVTEEMDGELENLDGELKAEEDEKKVEGEEDQEIRERNGEIEPEETEKSSLKEIEYFDDSGGQTTPMYEESTTPPTTETAAIGSTEAEGLNFTDSSTSTKSPLGEELITDAGTSPEVPSSTAVATDNSSSDSVTEPSTTTPDALRDKSDSSEATVTFSRKFTRSTKPTTADISLRNLLKGDKTTAATESTRSERFLRQTDCNELKLEMMERTKTTEPVDAVKSRSDLDDRNTTRQSPSKGYLRRGGKKSSKSSAESPRYIIELQEDPEESDKSWNPEEPILKVKMNIYSDSHPGNVYNFLSKLIPKNATSEEEPTKGLQIETKFRNGQPKVASFRNMKKNRERRNG